MPKYSEERKEAVLRKMLPPNNRALSELAAEEGISEGTLYNWRREARGQGRLLPDADAGPEGWSAADKFAAVVETAALTEAEVAEYCRKRGLYPEQIQAWRGACEQANDWEQARVRHTRTEEAQQRKRIRALERELKHKEKALAEAAALLVLSKKAAAIWGEDEDAGNQHPGSPQRHGADRGSRCWWSAQGTRL